MAQRPTNARITARTQAAAYDVTKYNAQDANEDAAILDDHADEIEANVTAIANKVDKVTGKGLSTEDYTTAEKAKVTNVPSNTTSELAAKADSTTVNSALSNKADLVNGIVSASQWPAGVDEVQEYVNLAAFPVTGASDIIYVALDTNITYRWGGTVYAALNTGIALGETSATAYRGDRGKTAYDHSQVTHDKTLVGLGNVDNTSDANKPVSTAAQTALNLKVNTADLNAGAVGLGNVENKSSATIRGEIVDGDIPVTIARAADVPTLLSDLTADSTHRTVTDTEKATWNAVGGITGAETDTPNAALDLAGHSMLTITLTGNLTVTSVTNPPAGPCVIRYIHGGYTLTVMSVTDFTNKSGSYYVTILNTGTTASPNLTVKDFHGGASVPSALGTFTGSSTTLSTSGYYTAATIAANTTLTFATSGHVEGSKHYVKLAFDGTDTLSVTKPIGITVKTLGFETGDTIPVGTYMLEMRIEGTEINVELKLAYAVAIALESTTLGITSEFPSGSSSSTIRSRAQAIYPAANGFIDSISIRHDSVSTNVTVGVYADSALTPAARVATSASASGNTSGQGWTTHSLTSPLAITKGTPIWIAWVYEGATTTYYRSTYSTSALRTASGYSLPDPFGAYGSPTLSYSAYANVRYDPETYNYVINEDFTNWSAGLPVGWTLNNGTDASNYVEANANGLRFVTAANATFGINNASLTDGQVYFCEVETYSITTLGADLYTATKFGDIRDTLKRSYIFTASGASLKILRPGGAADCVIRGIKVWQ